MARTPQATGPDPTAPEPAAGGPTGTRPVGSDQSAAAQPAAPPAGPTTSRSPGATGGAARAAQVKFDTSQLKSSYCNVCNGSSTREEVVLNFGLNSSWDLGRDQLEVALQHRIVLSPHAAKRVRDMMIRLIDEHESRYGKLDG